MKTIRLAAAALALSCEAAPTVDPGSVRFVQDAASHRVTVEYTLSGEPGVVTLDIETNCVDETGMRWASIGLANVTHASGDVNQIVASGTATRTIKWNANKSWPGHRIEAEGARAVVKAWSMNAPPDYMVVNLLNGRRFYYETEAQLPEGIGCDLYRMDAMVLRRIHAAGATALLGSSQQEVGRGTSYYETARWVSFTKDFYLGVFEVTHGQFRNVVGRSTWDGKIFTNAVDILVRPCETALYRSYGNDGGLCTAGAWPNADPAEARKAPAGSFFASLRGLRWHWRAALALAHSANVLIVTTTRFSAAPVRFSAAPVRLLRPSRAIPLYPVRFVVHPTRFTYTFMRFPYVQHDFSPPLHDFKIYHNIFLRTVI